jgi:type VI secretion system secreted protein VgrG
MSVTQEGRLLFLTTPLEADFLLIKRLRANEGLNKLFQFDLEILHEENEASDEPTLVDVSQLLGQPMTVKISQTDGTERFFNGICVQFNQGNRNARFTKYQAVLVPKIWLLTQKIQSRIFQQISVPDILRKVFEGFEVDYEIQGTFEQRNYCVQYRESDFDFASRLMEEEGIYYYFEHSDGNHRLIIANTPQSHRECPSKSEIPFMLDISELEEWEGTIRTWRILHQLRTGKVTLWDHNFQLPTSKLDAEQLSRFNIGGNQNLEFYDYQGEYAKRFDGIDKTGGEQSSELQKVFQDRQRVAEIRQQEIDVAYKTVKGTSDCSALTAGYRFKLQNHPTSENNNFHVLVNLQIEAVQSPSYNSDDSIANAYIVNFSCIPHGSNHAPFRPLRKTFKPIVQGTQTAIVVGPAGEEIFTDKYGRVKVQFHWDRQGRNDANSSCWIRVGTLWAGKQWGVIHIPRIGQEVIVDFIEGDPDQPIIVGSVYNPETMPPYTLPDNKTQSGVKSRSSKGGSASNFNEFRFEDKKGSEEIYLHAEKNWTIMVENDKNQTVGHDETHHVKHDRTKTVDNNETTTVKGNRTETVNGDETITITGKGGNRTESVEKNETITIGKDRKYDVVGANTTSVGKDEKNSVKGNKTDNIGKNYTLSVTDDISESAKKVTITAQTEIVLQGPGGSIKIDASGVTITGVLVKIN